MIISDKDRAAAPAGAAAAAGASWLRQVQLEQNLVLVRYWQEPLSPTCIRSQVQA